MKQLFSIDINRVKIIDKSKDSYDKYRLQVKDWGVSIIGLTFNDIEALENDKMLAFSDGEYTTFLILENDTSIK